MAQVGAIAVDSMLGSPKPEGIGTDMFVRNGSDDVYRRQLGLRPSPVILETTYIEKVTAAAAKTGVESRYALKGTIQSVTDSHGLVHADTFIADVEVHSVAQVRFAGALAWQIKTRWTVEGVKA